ncbi:hypothetical protein Q8F55_008380 [Vanrija albida]|uniref:Uncharacterized protein n=1 Tax=Vanrija albida TaxID=181172 RepID=A0ABR3PW65_9TREE
MSVMSTSYTARKLGRMDPGANGRSARALIADYVERRLEAGVPPSQIARDLHSLADKAKHRDNIDAGRAHLERFNTMPDIDVAEFLVTPQSSSIVRRLSGRARRPQQTQAQQPRNAEMVRAMRPAVVRLPSAGAGSEPPPPPYTRRPGPPPGAAPRGGPEALFVRLGVAESANFHLVTQLSAAEARIAQLEAALAVAQH